MQRSLQRNLQRKIDDNHNLSSENLNDSIHDIVRPSLGAIPRQTQIPQRLFVENEEKEREDVPLTEEQQEHIASLPQDRNLIL